MINPFRRNNDEASAPAAPAAAVPANDDLIKAGLLQAAQNDAEVFGFDLPKTLTSYGLPETRLALDLNEAWDLSVALVQEIASRKTGAPAKPFVVLVNDRESLTAQAQPENDERYMEMLGNLETVSHEGSEHGINLLFV